LRPVRFSGGALFDKGYEEEKCKRGHQRKPRSPPKRIYLLGPGYKFKEEVYRDMMPSSVGGEREKKEGGKSPLHYRYPGKVSLMKRSVAGQLFRKGIISINEDFLPAGDRITCGAGGRGLGENVIDRRGGRTVWKKVKGTEEGKKTRRGSTF